MLENRSFDHVLGFYVPPSGGRKVAGLTGQEFNRLTARDAQAATFEGLLRGPLRQDTPLSEAPPSLAPEEARPASDRRGTVEEASIGRVRGYLERGP